MRRSYGRLQDGVGRGLTFGPGVWLSANALQRRSGPSRSREGRRAPSARAARAWEELHLSFTAFSLPEGEAQDTVGRPERGSVPRRRQEWV